MFAQSLKETTNRKDHLPLSCSPSKKEKNAPSHFQTAFTEAADTFKGSSSIMTGYFKYEVASHYG